MAKFKLNSSGIQEILLGQGCSRAVGTAADRIAASVRGAVSGGIPVEADVLGPEPNQSGSRVRAAVIVRHPSPAGREAGIRALISAL